VRDPSTGAVLGRVLNSWWPYIFDINRFDTPFLPDATIVCPLADTARPSTPENVRMTKQSDGNICLEWDEPPDNVGVTRYEVHRDGQLLGVTPLRWFRDTDRGISRKSTYVIKARDGSANVSPPSAAVTVER
jgi:hypothetical protein